jgi:hypothetical protein
MKQFGEHSEKALKPGEKWQRARTLENERMKQPQSSRIRLAIGRIFTLQYNNLWFLLGMAMFISAVMLVWWAVTNESRMGNQLPNSALRESHPSGDQAIDSLEARIASLNEQMETLTNSVTYLESKLIRAHVLTDSILTAEQRASSTPLEQAMSTDAVRIVAELPSSAAGPASRQTPAGISAATQDKTVSAEDDATTGKSTSRLPDKISRAPLAPPDDTLAGNQSNTARTSQDATRMAAVTKFRAPADKQQTPASESRGGPWVVNLTSSPSKTSADLFAAKIRSRGIETQQQQVTVKGKHYWRVQTVGFSTSAEAQAYSEIISEKLGLKDVWIIKR